MLIYTHAITNRCRYIFDTILYEMLGIDYSITNQLPVFEQYNGEKFTYSNEPVDGVLHFFSTGLLFSDHIEAIEVKTFAFNNSVAFFQTPGSDFPFDIFAASFFLLSRYEEYLPSQKDQFGRFQGKKSLAFKDGFLETPVVNYWVIRFRERLLSKYPGLKLKKMQFKTTISFDIDVAYAFKGRSFGQNMLAISADLFFFRIKNLINRLDVILKNAPDPYDTYDHINGQLKHYSQRSIFFFLLTKKRTRYDRNISPNNRYFRKLIKDIAKKSETGIHPSFYSSEKKNLLQQEKETLEKISDRQITKSRQHFLRFKLPDTYRDLLQAGITNDYSMGYADLPGFRAGIACPFYFFDLLSDSSTKLRIHPISFMEGSFMKGKQNEPQQALECIKKLIATVKDVNGHFMCLWHNHTISELPLYNGWRTVFNEMMGLLAKP